MANASTQDQMNCMKIVETLLWLRSLKLIVAALLRLIDHALFRTQAFLIQKLLLFRAEQSNESLKIKIISIYLDNNHTANINRHLYNFTIYTIKGR